MIKRDALTNFRSEFSDLIKVSTVPLVMLHRPFAHAQRMALTITGHHLLLVSKREEAERAMAGEDAREELWVRTKNSNVSSPQSFRT